MSQVLGVFGLLDFTMLWPILLGACFETYEPFISLIFKFFSGRGKLRTLNQWTWWNDRTSKCSLFAINHSHNYTDQSVNAVKGNICCLF
jgi:hypothetical protein